MTDRERPCDLFRCSYQCYGACINPSIYTTCRHTKLREAVEKIQNELQINANINWGVSEYDQGQRAGLRQASEIVKEIMKEAY